MTDTERTELKALRAEQAELDKGVKEALVVCKEAEKKRKEVFLEKNDEKMEAANAEIFAADQNYKKACQAFDEVFSKVIQKLDELLVGEDEWERDKAYLDGLNKLAKETSAIYQLVSSHFNAMLVLGLQKQEEDCEVLRAISEEADEIDAKIQEILDKHL